MARKRKGTAAAIAAALTAALGGGLLVNSGDEAARQHLTLQQRSLRAHNTIRLDNQLGRLTLSDALSRKAKAHTRDMLDAGYLFHTTLGWCGTNAWCGENVGAGSTLDRLMRAFVESPEHFDNIVNPRYKYVGIGVIRENSGRVWMSVYFRSSPP